jgi:hypothetical protein
MSTPRDHHFIPVFYLKQWTGPDNKLIEYTVKHGKLIAKPVGPQATGYETDLYAFPELPADVRQIIEQNFFNYADRVASLALDVQLGNNQERWTPELWSAWSRFVIALHLRHPDAMPELRAGTQAIWEGSGAASQKGYEAIRKPDDPETFDEYLQTRDPHAAIKMRVNLIMRSFDNPKLGELINKMTWGVVDISQSPIKLLTSDRPLQFFNLKEPPGLYRCRLAQPSYSSPPTTQLGSTNSVALTHVR